MGGNMVGRQAEASRDIACDFVVAKDVTRRSAHCGADKELDRRQF